MRRPVSRTAIVIAILLGSFWAVLGIPVLLEAYNIDFLCFYIGGTLAREGRFADLYKPTAHWQVQQQAAPNVKQPMPAPRPPWFSLAIAPLTALPLVQAYAVWIAIMFGLLIATWVWGIARFGEPALLIAALFLPANLGLCAGQDGVAMLAVFCAAFVLLERKKHLAAGLVLGLALMKFHLVLLVPVWLIVTKRWRTLAGFTATGAVLIGGAFAALGIHGFASYADYLLHGHTEVGDHAPYAMLSVYGLLVNLGISSLVTRVLLAAAVVGLCVAKLRHAPLWMAMGIVETGSLLISPHVFGYDAAMLLLPAWLVMENSKEKFLRSAVLLLVMPMTFLFLLVPPPWRCVPVVAVIIFLVALVSPFGGRHTKLTRWLSRPAKIMKPESALAGGDSHS